MYSSSCNDNNPISYPHDQTSPHRPFLIDHNPISKQAEIPSIFSFPSPYPHFDEYPIILPHFPDFFLQQQTPLNLMRGDIDDCVVEEEAVISMVDSLKNDDVDGVEEEDYNTKKCENESAGQIQSKRSSKKDRHSKINTAHGLRDRRMRLSLEVARKFFDLQDMLGFDKASKTVEWLLMKSKNAIKELGGIGTNSGSSVSEECDQVASEINFDESCKRKPTKRVVKEKKNRVFHKNGFHPLARESREKARERARERTREKRKLDDQHPKLCLEATNQLRSWSPYEEFGNQSHSMNYYSLEVEELSSQEHLGSTMVINGGNWSPSIIFNYQNTTAAISQELQSTETQFYGKPWEA